MYLVSVCLCGVKDKTWDLISEYHEIVNIVVETTCT